MAHGDTGKASDSTTAVVELSRTEEALGSNGTQITRRFYRPELDVIRFIAFLMVFTHHLLGFESRLSRAMGQAGALAARGAS